MLALLTLSMFALVGDLLGRRLVGATGGRAARMMAAATLALGLAVAATRLLLMLGWFHLPLIWALAVAVGVPVLVASRRAAKRTGSLAAEEARRGSWRQVWAGTDGAALVPLAVGMVAIGLAAVTAAYLPIWAWDAVGYHLPFVNYVVQARSWDGVPFAMPYVTSYPHNADLLFALGRLALPDDTWIDAVQIPVGVIGAGAIAALAIRWGARPGPALAAGALWLAVPGVFLQLPSGYVDVCVATFLILAVYWIFSPVSPASLLLTGVALGLYLGSKPSAPLPALLLFGLAAWRAWRTQRSSRGESERPADLRAAMLGMVALTFALGAPDYLLNLWRFGNPLWPVKVDVGPIHLPGHQSVTGLLAAGADAPRLEGSLAWRVFRSWTSFRALPAFDMRIGGLGTVAVVLGIPGALLALRHVPRAVLLALVAALLGPDPAVARFILAFPALCLSLGAVTLSRLRRPLLLATVAAASVLAALDLRHAAPGLAGEGPPLSRYPAMSPEERLRAVGPAGRPDRWIDLRRSLGQGEAFAFDESFSLSYLLWRRDLGNRVLFVARDLSTAEVEALLVREGVRVLIAAPGSPAGLTVARRSACFRQLFACPAEPCSVYEFRGPECLQEGT